MVDLKVSAGINCDSHPDVIVVIIFIIDHGLASFLTLVSAAIADIPMLSALSIFCCASLVMHLIGHERMGSHSCTCRQGRVAEQ